MIAEFELSTITTKAGIIRHPAIFKGLREDKKAVEVVKETPIDVPKPIEESKEVSGSWEAVKNRKITSEEKFAVDGKQINLANIERHVWKDVSKAQLLQYYISISDYLLPYLKDRPLGINIIQFDPAESFFCGEWKGTNLNGQQFSRQTGSTRKLVKVRR